jgi:GDP-L-fucose synthase
MRLVTGSRGPLGFALQSLVSDEHNLFANSSIFDLTDSYSTLTFMERIHKSEKIESILHLAARSGGGHRSLKESAWMIRDNVLMAINILDACAKFGIRNIILVGSTASYPTNAINPTEEQIHNGEIESGDYAYGYAKRLLVPLMKAYNQQFDLHAKVVIVNGILGPHMNFDPASSILPAALISRFAQKKDSEEKLEVWGDGTPTRQYTHAQDLAQILIWCEKNQAKDSVLNVGATESITVRRMAELICENLGINAERLFFDSSKPNGKKAQEMENSKFIQLSGFRYMSIEESVRDTVRWYVENLKP